jgi:hypothetical protein
VSEEDKGWQDHEERQRRICKKNIKNNMLVKKQVVLVVDNRKAKKTRMITTRSIV